MRLIDAVTAAAEAAEAKITALETEIAQLSSLLVCKRTENRRLNAEIEELKKTVEVPQHDDMVVTVADLVAAGFTDDPNSRNTWLLRFSDECRVWAWAVRDRVVTSKIYLGACHEYSTPTKLTPLTVRLLGELHRQIKTQREESSLSDLTIQRVKEAIEEAEQARTK